VDAVRPDEDVGLDRGAIGEVDPHRRAGLLEAGATDSQVDGGRIDRRGEEGVELCPVHRDEAGPPTCLHRLSRLAQEPPPFGEPHSLADRARRECEHGVGHAEWVKGTQRVGPHPDAGPDLAQLGCLLVDRDLDAGLRKGDGRRDPLDPAPDDGDPGAHVGVRAQRLTTGQVTVLVIPSIPHPMMATRGPTSASGLRG
jgi:hypothetical protein